MLSKFCGNSVCNGDSSKKRRNPENYSKFLRICKICDKKYIGKTLYDEFLQNKNELDKEMSTLQINYDVYAELITNLDNQINDSLLEVF